MQLQHPFDATKIDPSQMGGQMPVGKHPVVIRESTIKPTKDQTSGYIEFTLQIIDGPSKDVTGPYRLNLYHTNPQTVEIAQRQLSALCHVTNVYQVHDTQQLHNIPFMVEVGLQKDADAAQKGYTEVKKVFDINGNEPGKHPAGGGQPQQQNTGGGGGWGGGQGQQQQAPQGQQGGGGGWGGGQQGQQQQTPPAGQGGGWQGGNQQGQQQPPASGGQGQGGWGQGGGSPPWGGKK